MDKEGILFIVVWIQPIFWMVFFNFKTDKLDRLFKPLAICLVAVAATVELIPSLSATVYGVFTTTRLMFLYSILGCGFTWYLMDVKKWYLPQALSISALAVFVGSFYWEVPYIIRNAILVGFEWDWFLHVMVIFLAWYIRDSVGWCSDKRKLVCLVCVGLIVSIIVMLIDPIAPGVVAHTKWNDLHYLLNRAICTVIVFILINKDEIREVVVTV